MNACACFDDSRQESQDAFDEQSTAASKHEFSTPCPAGSKKM